jgi:four helix bundle protein
MKSPAKKFQDLVVWQKAHKFVLKLYKLTKRLPKEELYGLTSQVRRSAVSIPANIAEGFRNKSNMDKARYLNISQGSLEETRYYLILIEDLGYSNTHKLMELLEEVSRILMGYRNKIINSDS